MGSDQVVQCCGPVFEGLLPPICEVPAQELIFIFAEWHGLAKLRLHTKDTLKIMKRLTSRLGVALREFAKLTEGLDIRETPKEYASRRKKYESNKAKSTTKRKRKVAESPDDPSTGDGRRKCHLNLDTYKMHSLGDYVRSIQEYGTTDSYSTQIVSLIIFS
jgi:hypothetical protein